MHNQCGLINQSQTQHKTDLDMAPSCNVACTDAVKSAVVMDPKVADALLFCAAAMAFKLFLVHFLTSRTRMMLDDPYGKKDWAKTKTSPLFSFWKATLLAYGPDFGGEAFVAATERLAKNSAECEPFFMCLAILSGVTRAVEASHLAMLITVFACSRVCHMMIMLAGPMIGIDLRIMIWMVGWCVTAYMCVLVFMLPSSSDGLMTLASWMATTSVVIVAAMFAPWNRA